MALTFTGTLSAATAGREEVRTLLIGAIGCNIAWGLVDAVMFLMSSLTERGRGLVAIHAVRHARSPRYAYDAIAGAMPPVLAELLKEPDLECMRQAVLGMRELPPRSLNREDWLGAFGVFLLVVLSTFPVVLPFMVIGDVHIALRVSNAIAVVLMFFCGVLLGRHGGYRPWRTGSAVALLGVALVGITIVLGG
jgi:VIT1/CCC1 family predicted Fe2+/Mn2+ transporter